MATKVELLQDDLAAHKHEYQKILSEHLSLSIDYNTTVHFSDHLYICCDEAEARIRISREQVPKLLDWLNDLYKSE